VENLSQLAELLRNRNAIDAQITALIGRPATTGHLGEYIAAQIFGIALLTSASHKDIDGHFIDGPLAGRSVNIKFYPKNDGLLSVSSEGVLDYILVLAGPRSPAMSSRGQPHPAVIEGVFLFDAGKLITELKSKGIKIGVATSVRQNLWQQAEIYPTQNNRVLPLSEKQRAILAQFHEKGG